MIRAIFAIDENRGIGMGNDLPWPMNESDMRFFRLTTEGNVIVMGRKTYDSIGSTPLPRRVNFVISTSEIIPEEIRVEGDVCSILMSIEQMYPDKDIFVIGGANILEQAKPVIGSAYVTFFKGEYECDTYIREDFFEGFEESYVVKENDEIRIVEMRRVHETVS